MFLSNIFSRVQCIKVLTNLQARTYAVKKNEPAIASLGKSSKKKGKFGPVVEKKRLPVEEDVNKLVNYVCGTNLLKEDGEDVKIKPNSEYPDWLWNLHIGPPLKLEELDPNTIEYWQRVRKLGRRRVNHMKSLKKYQYMR